MERGSVVANLAADLGLDVSGLAQREVPLGYDIFSDLNLYLVIGLGSVSFLLLITILVTIVLKCQKSKPSKAAPPCRNSVISERNSTIADSTLVSNDAYWYSLFLAETRKGKLVVRQPVPKGARYIVSSIPRSTGLTETSDSAASTLQSLTKRKMRLDVIANKKYLDVNKETGTLIAKVIAIDSDSVHNSRITYQFLHNTDATLFSLDQYNGEIRTMRMFSYRDSRHQQLVVIAKDNGEPALSATVTIKLSTVETALKTYADMTEVPLGYDIFSDLNLYLVIGLGSVSFLLLITILVTIVLKCQKTKPSKAAPPCRNSVISERNSTIADSTLVSNDAYWYSLFLAETRKGKLVVRQPVPKGARYIVSSIPRSTGLTETSDSAASTLQSALAVTHYSIPEEMEVGSVVANLASDLGLDAQTLIKRNVRLDVIANKKYLAINKDRGELYILEKIDRTLIAKVIAIDSDSVHNSRITYQFLHNTDATLFSLDQYNGEIRTMRMFSYRDSRHQQLVVIAKDNGEPALSATVTIKLSTVETALKTYADMTEVPLGYDIFSDLNLYLVIGLGSVSFLLLITILVTIVLKCQKTKPSKAAPPCRNSVISERNSTIADSTLVSNDAYWYSLFLAETRKGKLVVRQPVPKGARYIVSSIPRSTGLTETSDSAASTLQFLHNTDATLFSLDQYNGEIRTMRMFSYRDSRHQQLVVIAKDNGEPALSATVTIKLSTVETALKTYADMTEVPLGYDIFSDLNLYLVIGLGSVSFLLLITILVTIVLKCQKTKPSKAAPPCRNSVISERNSTIADSTLVSNDAYWYSLFLAETRKGKLVVRQPVPKGARYIVSSIPRSTGLTETSDSAASTLQFLHNTDATLFSLDQYNGEIRTMRMFSYRDSRHQQLVVIAKDNGEPALSATVTIKLSTVETALKTYADMTEVPLGYDIFSDLNLYLVIGLGSVSFLLLITILVTIVLKCQKTKPSKAAPPCRNSVISERNSTIADSTLVSNDAYWYSLFLAETRKGKLVVRQPVPKGARYIVSSIPRSTGLTETSDSAASTLQFLHNTDGTLFSLDQYNGEIRTMRMFSYRDSRHQQLVVIAKDNGEPALSATVTIKLSTVEIALKTYADMTEVPLGYDIFSDLNLYLVIGLGSVSFLLLITILVTIVLKCQKTKPSKAAPPCRNSVISERNSTIADSTLVSNDAYWYSLFLAETRKGKLVVRQPVPKGARYIVSSIPRSTGLTETSDSAASTLQFLHNTDATLFSLDQYNGEIRTMRMFSYRDSRHQQLVVIAKDNGEPALSATVTIKLSTVETALKTYADMTEVPLGYDIFSDLNLYLVIGLGSVSFLLLITILVTIVLKCQKTKPSKAAPPCRNSVISERNSTIADSTLVSNDAYWYSLFLAETRKGKLVVRQPVPKGARYIVSSIPRSTGLTETSDSAPSTLQFLHNTDATLFNLDQYNGEIRTMRMFSYRDSRHQQLVVIAKDNGEPALSATVTIKLSTVETALKTYADMTEVPLGYDIFSDLNLYLVIGLGSVSFLLLITILVTIVLKCQKTKPSKAAPPCRNSVISERNSTIADSTLVSNDAYWYSLFLAETRKGKLVVRQPVPKGARYIVSSIPRSTGLTETSDSAASTLQFLHNTDATLFSLDQYNGEIRTMRMFSYRDSRHQQLGVIAKDNGEPALSATVTIKLSTVETALKTYADMTEVPLGYDIFSDLNLYLVIGLGSVSFLLLITILVTIVLKCQKTKPSKAAPPCRNSVISERNSTIADSTLVSNDAYWYSLFLAETRKGKLVVRQPVPKGTRYIVSSIPRSTGLTETSDSAASTLQVSTAT
ncbi:protocadherin alpha-C2-like protein [Labeo rohita]|uniref:Protocadherin alpha-C2-like protein n=1 Tax=Labeo rohita TaxID=84645 RepID=A0A498MYR2_LABRO|nr:protocadherin alpha-C2-like protein [Labeo rohita]